MFLTLAAICAAVLCLLIGIRIKRKRDQRDMEMHSITPEALHSLLASNQEIHVYDVRVPLDFLADSVIIVGATRIAPKDILEHPSLIPKDKDSVVYCTCPSDQTSQTILRRARALGFSRIKFLQGGLEGWKARGYPVEPYKESFHLDTAS